MNLVLADTGPLYAAVDPDDAHHERAVRELGRLAQMKAGILVAYPMLLEAYTLVPRRLGRVTAGDWLSDVLESANWVNPDGSDYGAAAQLVAQFADQDITLQAQPVFAGAAPLRLPLVGSPGRPGIGRVERQAEVSPRQRNGTW